MTQHELGGLKTLKAPLVQQYNDIPTTDNDMTRENITQSPMTNQTGRNLPPIFGNHSF